MPDIRLRQGQASPNDVGLYDPAISVPSSDGSADGSAAVSGVGAAVFAGVASCDGLAAASSVGASIFAAVASSAGAVGVSGTDDFTGTNGTTPPNANWTAVLSAMQIQSNQVAGADPFGPSCARWNASVFDDAHYSKLTFASSSSGFMCIGPAIRCQNVTASFFYAFGRDPGGSLFIGECVGGFFTNWEITTMPSVGTVMELAVDATTSTTIYYKENGVVVRTFTGKSALSGGSPGICSYLDDASHRGDDWQGGNVVSGVGGTVLAAVASSAGIATVAGEGENTGEEVPPAEVPSVGGELIGKRRPRLRWTDAGDPDPVQVIARGIELRIESGNGGVEVQVFALPSARHALTLCRSDAPTLCTTGAAVFLSRSATLTLPAPRPTRVRAVRNPSEEDLMLTHLSLIE